MGTSDEITAAGVGRRLTVDPRWGLAATASLALLAVLAPGGLALVGFLGVVIALHEAGHFVVARRVGMVPTRFFWGFGPEVVGVQVGSCRYGLRAIFAGGYVRVEGMTPSSSLPDGFDEAGTFRAGSHRARLAAILAGVAVNLVSAVVAFAGARILDGEAMGSVAGAAGLVAASLGDVWTVVEATAWSLWTLAANVGSYLQAVVGTSGVNEAPVRFMSPVGQAQASQLALSLGPAIALRWFAVLSVAVGVINLIPLPPLDGGHAAVAVVEWLWRWVRGDRSFTFDATRLEPLAWVTVVALVALSVSALVLDIRALA